MSNKTNGELLKELIELVKPINELAKYQIQSINTELQKAEIIKQYAEAQQEATENDDLDADLEVVETEEL